MIGLIIPLTAIILLFLWLQMTIYYYCFPANNNNDGGDYPLEPPFYKDTQNTVPKKEGDYPLEPPFYKDTQNTVSKKEEDSPLEPPFYKDTQNTVPKKEEDSPRKPPFYKDTLKKRKIPANLNENNSSWTVIDLSDNNSSKNTDLVITSTSQSITDDRMGTTSHS